MRMAWAEVMAVALAAFGLAGARAEIEVPGHSLYVLPATPVIRPPTERTGRVRWTDPGQSANWFVQIRRGGELAAKVRLPLAAGDVVRLRLTVAGVARDAQVTGQGADHPVVADFGAFRILRAGSYQRFMLQAFGADDGSRAPAALLLDGPATAEARFFTTPAQRGAPSCHLGYETPRNMKVAAFYCEVAAVTDPPATYYMACGWHRGYFGMQVNSLTERRIIFSVWDSGNEGVSRSKVAAEDRVQLIAKGEGVVTDDFGNEGTGGHSHLVYPWKTGARQRFIVAARPVDATHTIFSGYWFRPDRQQWMLISSWKAPKDGGYLRGLYSFSEDFAGSGQWRRKALYGNQWVRSPDGVWRELTVASFSHTGDQERFDRCMGVEQGQFFLAAGGFLDGTTEAWKSFSRPPTGRAPQDIRLPPLPMPAAH